MKQNTKYKLGFLNRFNRPHTEIAEWYWLTQYLDYSDRLDNIVKQSGDGVNHG